MTFALGPATERASSALSAERSSTVPTFAARDSQTGRFAIRIEVAPGVEAPPAREPSRRSTARRCATDIGHAARVALGGPGARERRDGIHRRCADVEGEDALRERRTLVAQTRTPRQKPLVGRLLHPEARAEIANSCRGGRSERCVIAKNGIPWNSTRLIPGSASKMTSKMRWPLSWAANPPQCPPGSHRLKQFDSQVVARSSCRAGADRGIGTRRNHN